MHSISSIVQFQTAQLQQHKHTKNINGFRRVLVDFNWAIIQFCNGLNLETICCKTVDLQKFTCSKIIIPQDCYQSTDQFVFDEYTAKNLPQRTENNALSRPGHSKVNDGDPQP